MFSLLSARYERSVKGTDLKVVLETMDIPTDYGEFTYYNLSNSRSGNELVQNIFND